MFLYCTTRALLVSPSKIKFGLRHKFVYINYINDGIEEQVFSYLTFPSSFFPLLPVTASEKRGERERERGGGGGGGRERENERQSFGVFN